MNKGTTILTKLTDTDNFEGVQPGREHLELLMKSKALKTFDRSQANSTASKIDAMLMKLYLSL